LVATSGWGEEEKQLPRIPFADVTEAAGISFVHENGAYGEKLLPEMMGGGVAFFDYDGDGDADLLFVNSARWPWREGAEGAPVRPVVLYANDGKGAFRDVTAESGLGDAVPAGFYGQGVAIADVDGDGWRDLFLTAVGANRLLRNREGRFADATAEAGVAGAADGWSTGAAFYDADGDGDLDLVVADYLAWSREIDAAVERDVDGVGATYGRPQSYGGGRLWLFRNEGGGRFGDASEGSGLEMRDPQGRSLAKPLAVVPFDADGDRVPDLFVANDTTRNFYFRGKGGGRYAEEAEMTGLAYDPGGRATGAMGVDHAWLDGRGPGHDAALALAVGNFADEPTSAFVAGDGGAFFTDESLRLGLAATTRAPLTFGVLLADLDLDGRPDLVQANGHVEPDIARLDPAQSYLQPAQVLWNAGPRFVELPADRLGDLPRPMAGRGLAAADIDGDGDLDLAITQVGGPARLLRNDQATGHRWLRVTLRGAAANRDAIGANVELVAEGATRRHLVSPTRSYLSQVEPTVTFGLGRAEKVDSLTVTWPDGTVQRVTVDDGTIGRHLTIEKPATPAAPSDEGRAAESRP
jgi:enediyne biosynthesis protein E4